MIDKDMQKAMTEALASGDTKAIEAAALAITKSKADRAKVEAEALRIEAEALAGKRTELETVTLKAVKTLGLDQLLVDVKSKGFTYTIDHKEDDRGRIDVNGSVTVKGGVGLLVPVIKSRSGGTGGGAGKTKDEFGLSLTEVYEKFATDADRTAMVAAEVKDVDASAKLGKQTNSNAWRVKNDVKKQALADGLLSPNK